MENVKEILNIILNISSNVITKVLLFISLYYMIISFFGLIRIKDKKKVAPKKSFALLVAAHNEEKVVKDIIHSLQILDYPKELYDIFVIADNCTDKTAAIARRAGATVFERKDKEKRGKGYALEWMFNKIYKMEKQYDSVVVFDADNLVSKGFLYEMNKKLCAGYKVVQGYLDSKNPCDTWITGSYSISFWTSNRMFQLSRSNLGLSNQLGGTGFCISLDILRELGWGATCLTEDLEFSCKLVLNGQKVGWAHDAVIYDEKPLTLKQSWFQRKRWMQGFADVSGRYFWRLMKRAITKLDIVAFDCAIYSIQPIIIIIVGFGTILNMYTQIKGLVENDKFMDGIVNIFAGKIQGIIASFHNVSQTDLISGIGFLTILYIFIGVMQLIFTPLVLILERKLSLKVVLYYIVYPIYFITWIPISILGIIDRNKKEWSHTAHTRSVNIAELEKVN
jgi:cellulose synthase/poly-beta-1,6-N-acetylglucosamine synthase-like glycosyltransferase